MHLIFQILYYLTPLELELTRASSVQGQIRHPPPDVYRCPGQCPGRFCLLFVPCSPLFFLISILQNNIWLSPGQISVHFLCWRIMKFSYSPFLSYLSFLQPKESLTSCFVLSKQGVPSIPTILMSPARSLHFIIVCNYICI